LLGQLFGGGFDIIGIVREQGSSHQGKDTYEYSSFHKFWMNCEFSLRLSAVGAREKPANFRR
jgi:hypothetical protein